MEGVVIERFLCERVRMVVKVGGCCWRSGDSDDGDDGTDGAWVCLVVGEEDLLLMRYLKD